MGVVTLFYSSMAMIMLDEDPWEEKDYDISGDDKAKLTLYIGMACLFGSLIMRLAPKIIYSEKNG